MDFRERAGTGSKTFCALAIIRHSGNQNGAKLILYHSNEMTGSQAQLLRHHHTQPSSRYGGPQDVRILADRYLTNMEPREVTAFTTVSSSANVLVMVNKSIYRACHSLSSVQTSYQSHYHSFPQRWCSWRFVICWLSFWQ